VVIRFNRESFCSFRTERMADSTDDPLSTNKVMGLERKVYP
jgi:hypothetical protein